VSRLRDFWRNTRLALGVWGVGALLLVLGVIVAFQFVGPAPPDRIVMATGAEGGAYRQYGRSIAALLAREDIEVELRETAGSVENLELLDQGAVDIGFVQGGLAARFPTDGVVTLGSLYFEPLWIFVPDGDAISSAADFAGKRLAVGAPGSGTRAVAEQLLGMNGIGPDEARFLDTVPDDLDEGLEAGDIDAAFVVGAPDSPVVIRLLQLPGVSLLGLRRTDAYVRHEPFLSRVDLPEGVLDLDRNLPPRPVATVGVAAMLGADDDLHPALVDLLLVSVQELFGGQSLLADAGQFPTPRYADLPLSEEAERFYEHGPPFLMRYLPFWAATLVDRLWVLLLPLIGLAIPLFKLLPPFYRWRIRRRLLRRYAVLESIDPFGKPVADAEDRHRRLRKLKELDDESASEIVPLGYVDDVYKLRRDIDLVRRRLDEP
jgi:TRAP transporter TAXI family solute receptor